MEKNGDGVDVLRHHHAIRVPLTAEAPEVAAAMEEDSSESVSLRQKASKVMASTAAAYRSKPASFWSLLVLSAGAMLTAFPASSLLSRVYYNGGGQSKWILSWSAVAGWPIPALLLLPCYLFLDGASPTWPPPPRLCLWYALLGLLSAADNLMYAWAYEYLPASTASLVAASSLAFSAVFGRIIVRKNNRMGLATVNAIVVITAGVVIVALDSGSDRYPGITDKQYAVGFVLDVAASALHGLIFALSELAFATHLARASGSNGGGGASASRFHVVLEQQAAVTLSAFAFTSAGLAPVRGGVRGDEAGGGGVQRRRGRCGGVRDGVGVVGGDVPAGGAWGDGGGVPGVDGACWRAERGEGAGDERGRGDLVPRPHERVQDPVAGDHRVGVRVVHGRPLRRRQENLQRSFSNWAGSHELILQ